MSTITTQNAYGYRRAQCDNCGEQWNIHELAPIADAQERLTAGEETPAGECPDCGALTYGIKYPAPVKATRFNHQFSVAFDIESAFSDPDNCTERRLIAGLLKRAADLAADIGGAREAFQFEDSYEIQGEQS